MPTIRELIHKIVFKVENREALERSNRAIDDTADNSRRATRQAGRFERALGGLLRRARSGAIVMGRLARGVGRFAASSLPIVGGALVGVLGAVTATGITAANSLDRIGKAAEKLGVGAGELDALTQAAALADISFEKTEVSIQKLLKSAADAERGLSTPRDAFKALGVDVLNSNGQIKTAQELLVDVAGGLEAVPSQAKRIQIAMDIFGRSGADALRLLQGGADDFQATLRQVSAAGLVTNQDTRRAARFNDSITTLLARLRRVRDIIGSAIFPAIANVFESVSDYIARNIGEVEQFGRALADRITAFFEGDGPQKFNDGIRETVRLLVAGAQAAGKLIDLVTTDADERDANTALALQRTQRNARFNNRGVQGQVTGTLANIRAAVTGADRRAADALIASRANPRTSALVAQRTSPTAITGQRPFNRSNTDIRVDAPVTVNVTEGNAERAGRSFGRGVVDGARNSASESDAQSVYGG